MKSIFLGVVAPPSGDFDEQVFLRRVSEIQKYKQRSHNQNFNDSPETNTKLSVRLQQRLIDVAWKCDY